MMCIPPVSFPSSLSTVHLFELSIKHDMRRAIIENKRRGDLGALHAKVTGRAKGGEVSSVFYLCGFCQAEFCLVHCHAPDNSQDFARSPPRLVSAVTNPRGKVKLLIECKDFVTWLTAYSRAADCLLAGHK